MNDILFERIRRAVLTMILIFMTLFLGRPAYAAPGEAEAKTRRIAIATDLHLDPRAQHSGVVNPLAGYNMELIDALLYDVAVQEADILVLCGDITNSGSDIQYETLAEKLKKAEEHGFPVYVIPGNHDADSEEGAERFAQSFAQFGFQEALSRDNDSLSYSVLPKGDGFMILMLDTDGYTSVTGSAQISAITLQWVRSQLELAKENGWQVLSAGHFPILTGYSTPFSGREELAEMLKEYNVPLYLCGHLHQRNVVSDGGLTELVVEQLISYPCSYAMLFEEDGRYVYQPRNVDVSAWASLSGPNAEELVDFETFSAGLSGGKSDNLISVLNKDNKLSLPEQELAISFFNLLMEYYSCGELYYHLQELYDHPGYELFMEISVGSNYDIWLPVILERAVPYTTGFVIENNNLMLPE